MSKPPVGKEPDKPMGVTREAGGNPEASPPQAKSRKVVEDPMEPSSVLYIIPKENKIILYTPSTNVISIMLYERLSLSLGVTGDFEVYIWGNMFKNIKGVFIAEDSSNILRMLVGRLRRVASGIKTKEGGKE